MWGDVHWVLGLNSEGFGTSALRTSCRNGAFNPWAWGVAGVGQVWPGHTWGGLVGKGAGPQNGNVREENHWGPHWGLGDKQVTPAIG